ncbi:hypothetical protein LTR82_009601 [Friedmanniomyces endolithicus]|uniref:Pentacotripeptide-repeat region of PRORP domain-containing protein n=1 Tax=Friedmanniomyces endolithicus TaxID=329885 RepID=A0AAN6FJR1_9PEZI|nr:hypothetical protein LTR82_009601 [Friedmanniomyces endolithicus]
MFDCGACALRAIRAVASECLTATRPHARLLLTPHLTRRTATTASATSTASTSTGAPYLSSAQLRHEERTQSDSFVPLIRRHKVHDPDAATRADLAVRKERAVERALQKELQWLGDPAKLADHVHYTLRCDNPDKALELCRMASNDMQCVVSWNHCLDWFMKQGRVQDALKVYNEMKERAQFPDAFTYTLLLRGLAGLQREDKWATVAEEHVSKAVSVYTSMSSPTSRVKPSIIHTNAALKVCAFGQDMDALWGIVGKMPDIGSGAADHVTYSIILHALRNEVQSLASDVKPQAASAKREQAMQDGRRVWMEVVKKWRGGQVKLDEELVCAMGRVLLASQRLADWDDVLNLVQQTMQIERLVAPYGSAERQTGHVPQLESSQLESNELSASEQEHHDGYVDAPAAKAFHAVQPMIVDKSKPNRRAITLEYVTPGNATLSLLLETCSVMRTPKTASAYWTLLTSETHGIKPDIANFNSHLRNLQKNRASGQAAKLVKEDLIEAGVQPMMITFRIAMDACARDWKNANAIEHATSILGAMEATIADPDVETLKKYLSLALTTSSGPKVVAALDRMDSIVHNLRSRVLYGPAAERLTPQKELQVKSEALGFFRQLIGAIDTLMDRGLVPQRDYVHWSERRNQLTKFVGRVAKSVEGSEERLVERGLLGDGRGGVQRVARREVMFEGGKELAGFRGNASSASQRRRAGPSRGEDASWMLEEQKEEVGERRSGMNGKWWESSNGTGNSNGRESSNRRETSWEDGANRERKVVKEKGYAPVPGFANSPADFGM